MVPLKQLDLAQRSQDHQLAFGKASVAHERPALLGKLSGGDGVVVSEVRIGDPPEKNAHSELVSELPVRREAVLIEARALIEASADERHTTPHPQR